MTEHKTTQVDLAILEEMYLTMHLVKLTCLYLYK